MLSRLSNRCLQHAANNRTSIGVRLLSAASQPGDGSLDAQTAEPGDCLLELQIVVLVSIIGTVQ